jgi:hypothetical protein
MQADFNASTSQGRLLGVTAATVLLPLMLQSCNNPRLRSVEDDVE